MPARPPDGRSSTPASSRRSPTWPCSSRAKPQEAGITLNVGVESLDTFYGAQWCPAEPEPTRPARARPSSASSTTATAATPDVYLNAALKTKGVWNSSQYSSPRVRRRVHRVPGRGRRRCPEGRLHEDRDDPQSRTSPSALPYFYNYLAGNSNKFTGRVLERPRADVLLSRPPRSDPQPVQGGGRSSPSRTASHAVTGRGDVVDGTVPPARLLLSLITLWLLATIVFVIANVLPTDVGRTILGPFAPQETRRRAQRAARHQPPAPRAVRPSRCAASSRSTSATRSSSGAPVLPTLLDGDRSVRQAGGPRAAHHDPDQHRRRLFAARRRDRPIDRAIVLFGVTSSSIPEFVTGTFLVVVVGVQLGWLPVLATPPRGAGPPHRAPLPAHARAGDGHRLLRVHRADDPGRHDRGPPVGLHRGRRR